MRIITHPFVESLPKQWAAKEFKSITKLKVVHNNVNEELLSVFLNRGVVRYTDTSQKQVHKPSEDMSKYQLVEPRDIVLNNQQAWRGSVGVSKFRGIVSPAYYVLSLDTDINDRYFNYLIQDRTTVAQFYIASRGVGSIQRNIYYPELKNVVVFIPPRDEQDQIVRWLDWRTSRINKLVRSKRREIECLKELKKAVISKAVTQGLNADAELKDSGAKWLGSVPAHWGVSTVKKHFRIKKEIAGKEGYDVLSITQHGLKVKNVKSNEGQIAQDYSGYQFVHPGDFAMNHMDLITGYVDYSTLFGVTSPDYRVFQLRDESKDYPHYFLRLLQNCYHRRIFYAFGRGAAEKGRWRLPKENFEAFDIPIPPREEQEAIAAYLDKKCDEIDNLIAKLTEEIALVEEYKTRIISDAVTGEIDLRNVAVPDYEVVEEESSVEGDDEETEEDTGDDEN
jgi:type I restriction enzyme S subunit